MPMSTREPTVCPSSPFLKPGITWPSAKVSGEPDSYDESKTLPVDPFTPT